MASAGSAQLEEGLVALWNSSGLNALFQAFWTATQILANPVLHDTEASPGQAFPYCVYNVTTPTTISRDSGHDSIEKHEIRDTPIEFRIHAQSSGGLSAKRIAADMANEVIKIFGGHPSVSPTAMTLTDGGVMLNQYQNDFGLRTEDDNHLWMINYLAKLDVPMRV